METFQQQLMEKRVNAGTVSTRIRMVITLCKKRLVYKKITVEIRVLVGTYGVTQQTHTSDGIGVMFQCVVNSY